MNKNTIGDDENHAGMNRIKEYAWMVIRRLGVGPWVLRTHPKSILLKDGWFRSFRENRSIDGQGNDIPWLTYPSIRFIESRLNKEFRLFEYGSGSSTIWYAKRVCEVLAVEHNLKWMNYVKTRLPVNAKVILQTNPDEYPKEIEKHGAFHIIVIDGILRDYCIEPALASLLPNGVVIWDNSDRADFMKSLPQFIERGFREIPFYGLSPMTFVPSQTSVLYRTTNCFGI